MDKKRILLVDDSPTVLATLSDQLYRYSVVLAESGEEAIEILENPISGDLLFSNMFDLIITDLKMPGISGFEVAKYVREKNKVNKFTPVIMLTSENVTKDEARKHGCAAMIPKTNIQKIVGMVDILLSR